MKYKLKFPPDATWMAGTDQAIIKMWPNPIDADGLSVQVESPGGGAPRSVLVSILGLPFPRLHVKYTQCLPEKTAAEKQNEQALKGDEFVIAGIPDFLSWKGIFNINNQLLREELEDPLGPKGLIANWQKPADMNGEKVHLVSICDDLYPYAYQESWYVYHTLYPLELFPVPAKNLLQKISKKVCRCNVFVTGCVCGIFKEEQARKKAMK